MKKIYHTITPVIFLLLTVFQVQASSLALPNTFKANTPAKAAEVNANFSAVKTSVNDNQSQIAALIKKIATLQTQLSSVASNSVMDLGPYLTVDTTDPSVPVVRLSGVNLQVVNGLGHTDSKNGLGNIIIGYDEADTSSTLRCTIGTDSKGSISDATACANAGGTWSSTGFKTGSHDLIVGAGNNYSSWGAVVVGYQNTSNNAFASVTGGMNNMASGPSSSISGGVANTASGALSSVSGGFANTANGDYSSVSGGNTNWAAGDYSSVSGGIENETNGQYSSVSGGSSNGAMGQYSSIGGGVGNQAYGNASSVSGGKGNRANGDTSSILGGSHQAATGSTSTIPVLP